MASDNQTTEKEMFTIGDHALCVSVRGRGARECVIVGGLEMRNDKELGIQAPMYLIDVPSAPSPFPSKLWYAYPRQLIKLSPLNDEEERLTEAII